MSVQKTVTVEQTNTTIGASGFGYRVIRTRNTLDPAIRKVLTKDEVQALIDQGIEVVVNDRK